MIRNSRITNYKPIYALKFVSKPVICDKIYHYLRILSVFVHFLVHGKEPFFVQI